MIAESLHENTTLKGLNFFKNIIDVDGARAIGKLLQKNSTIEWLDIGHNRIRMKGLEAIQNGIVGASNSNLKTLGIRMNFISDHGFADFFEAAIFSGKSKISTLYIQDNNLTESKQTELWNKTLACPKLSLFVDKFEKIQYTTDAKMNKTLFFTTKDIHDNKASVNNVKRKEG